MIQGLSAFCQFALPHTWAGLQDRGWELAEVSGADSLAGPLSHTDGQSFLCFQLKMSWRCYGSQ